MRRLERIRRDLAIVRRVATLAVADARLCWGVRDGMADTLAKMPALEGMHADLPDVVDTWVRNWTHGEGRYLLQVAAKCARDGSRPIDGGRYAYTDPLTPPAWMARRGVYATKLTFAKCAAPISAPPAGPTFPTETEKPQRAAGPGGGISGQVHAGARGVKGDGH